MNLLEFVDNFTDIIPFNVEVKVDGESRKSKFIKPNENNYKGKEFSMGLYSYELPERATLPITINIRSSQELISFFEKTSTLTNGESTSHTIKVFDANQRQVGYVVLDITAAGDIKRKECYYNGPDDRYRIVQKVHNDFIDGKVIRREEVQYRENQGDYTNEVTINKLEDKVTCVSCVTRNNKDSNVVKGIYSSTFVESSYDKKKRVLQPDHMAVIENAYPCGSFIGEYKGSTLIMSGHTLDLYVHTSKNGHNLYTYVNLTDINPYVKKESMYKDDEIGIYSLIKHADKTPLYDTEMLEDTEILVGHNGEIATKENEREFEWFKEKYIDTFATVPEIVVENVLKKLEKKSNQ